MTRRTNSVGLEGVTNIEMKEGDTAMKDMRSELLKKGLIQLIANGNWNTRNMAKINENKKNI